MKTAQVQPNFDELWKMIRQMPRAIKVKLYQALDADLHGNDIENEFRQALEEVWAAYAHIPEDEINADIDLALEQVRAEYRARGS
ncbi:MAG: hypothetical protein HDKAJFGB_04188 [Anaerolineae bacterium]|nr:hypothetical protein [Anaerolineae bacterium]RIK27275.1 MAG: hypothetical protein DCC52_09475 [Chloroflexota bacterium]